MKIKDLSLYEYDLLMSTGMFWELYPEATGRFKEDVQMSIDNKFKIENDE
jgi:hypothetical protein